MRHTEESRCKEQKRYSDLYQPHTPTQAQYSKETVHKLNSNENYTSHVCQVYVVTVLSCLYLRIMFCCV